uniref:DNA 3'-5' helicase n=1 Tax=Echinostoma caproni TaxID=27848 RepID=A0A183B1J4_9TREM
LPRISFVCVDEAHCLADWSHHFRPSYLRVCRILRDTLGVSCFLGLSATCTPSTISNVCKNLGMPDGVPRLIGDRINEDTLFQPGYVQPTLSPIPPNLTITASTDVDREEALLGLLTRPPFCELTGGILVYCATRDQTERLASFVRTSLQSVVNQVGRRRMEWTTAAYHAGQTSTERARIQKRFMTGRLRVLFATTAFGMGVNKPDLQAVIHYSLTRSFENYIQVSVQYATGT